MAGANGRPPARLRWLHTRAVICQTFPAYRLHDFEELNGRQVIDLLQAMTLLDTAHKMRTPGS